MTNAFSAPGWPIERGVQTLKEVHYLNMRTQSAAAGLSKLWGDTFLTSAGINAGASSGYNYRGSANYDVIRNTTSPVSLLLHLNELGQTDDSASPATGTLNGDAAFSTTQKKFGDTSLFCDGTGDYLRYADAAKFDVGSGDFCFEGFFRADSLTGLKGLFDVGRYTLATGFCLYISTSNIILLSNDATVCSAAHGMSINSWYHIAVVRSSGTVKIYIGGTEIASASLSATLSTAYGLDIGGTYNTTYFEGYIDEVRFSNVARYTGAFTPTASAFTTDANTLLLCHFENTPLDSSSSTHTITKEGGASVSTTQKKFGNGSVYFDGVDDYLTVADADAWDYAAGSNQFTIDFWVRFDSVTGNRVFWCHQNSGNPDNHDLLRLRFDGSNLIFDNNTAYAGYEYINKAWAPSINTWYHVALEKNGTTYTLYIDGTSIGSNVQASISPTYTGVCRIGCQWDSAYQWGFAGYIDEFRFSTYARYTSNFTAPAAEGTAEAAGNGVVRSVQALALSAAVTSAMVFCEKTLNTGTITVEISSDNGSTWTTVSDLDQIMTIPSGTQIALRATITGDAELESWGVAV